VRPRPGSSTGAVVSLHYFSVHNSNWRADHLPLYRQAQIYERQGIQLDRSTLADWVGRAAFHL
jgi:transposase